jgi:site-specific DNA-methyltransferase (adenine-specific)
VYRASVGTRTTSFGAGRREAHDASAFYDRFTPPIISDDDVVAGPGTVEPGCIVGDASKMAELPDASVALVVTSPPYFVGKEYEEAVGEGHVPGSYVEFLAMLRDVFAECHRVLEPGGRIAVNIANLGRKPYRSLAADVIAILQDDLGMLLRGEVVWMKAEGASGSCAWGSFRSPSNPVLRDTTERVVIASKGRFDRAHTAARRRSLGLPHVATSTNDEFLDATIDVWRIPAESARRVGHPAPFPSELVERLIHLYTYEGDVVLDPFLGSGSTLVAASRTGRAGVGYDIDEQYVRLAEARIATEVARHSATHGTFASAAAAEKPIGAVAIDALTAAGFTIEAAPWKLKGTGVTVDALARDARGGRWYVGVYGAFTVVPSGLARTDAAWRAVGRSAVLREHGCTPVLLLTSHLPARGTEPDLALRGVGRETIFGVVPLLDEAGASQLQTYAQQGIEAVDR